MPAAGDGGERLGGERFARIALAAAHQRVDLAAQRGGALGGRRVDLELLDQAALLEDRNAGGTAPRPPTARG